MNWCVVCMRVSSFIVRLSTFLVSTFGQFRFRLSAVHTYAAGVKSKETVGHSWTVLEVILGHKYHHNH